MSPKKGIVRSGNAGNSSKSAPKPRNNDWKKAANVYDGEPPKEPAKLFPDGYKFPLSLLQERCQKNGWLKPNVTTRQVGDNQFAFAVTLSRLVQKSTGQETETVRLEPHPPYLCPSAIEARHWGATYALYRFCNGIRLDRVLPPAPRDYWRLLEAEHKTVPEHRQWEYAADPFTARKSVNERQDKAEQKREHVKSGKAAEQAAAKEFADELEVKMATELRDVVEAAIQQEIANHSEAEDDDSLTISEAQAPDLTKQLLTLGFTNPQARKAITYLSTASPFAAQLLRFSNPLSALIEYLVLHVPECDLPPRFLPGNNSSNPFVMGAHGKKDDIALRWIEDRAVKLAGWPIHAVKEAMVLPHLQSDWAALIYALNRRLVGNADWSEPVEDTEADSEDTITDEDIEAMGATWDQDGERVLSMALFSAPLTLHFVLPESRPYDRQSRPPPMYITSPSAPAYVRLHLLACVLRSFEDGSIKEAGHGILLGAMQVVDEQWAVIEDEGPPDIADVLKHLMPQKEVEEDDGPAAVSGAPRRSTKKTGRRRLDPRSDAQVKEEFEKLKQTAGYKKMLATRERLPAFRSRGEFLEMLDKSRVVVVVGETGSGKTTQLPQFVLDALISNNAGKSANILITQPRRISAISVAARVSSERCDDGSVGYSIRGESKSSEKTKLLFCTTGVVLRRMSGGDNLGDVTHVIVDEVHERSVDGDFLLLELKELLRTHKTLKVILMSATINHETFIRYFNGAPLLSIPGFTHPVKDVYLEDVWNELKYTPQVQGRGGPRGGNSGKRGMKEEDDDGLLGVDERTASALKTLDRAERLDYGLVAAVVDHIMRKAQSGKGGILIFLPGVQEIRQCIDALKNSLSPTGVTIFPLHANLSSDEQRAVFGSVAGWKIVVATNVAETSITIDDIVYVVDAGKVKETQFDASSGLSKLVEDWVTRAAARQRRGRAGRTQPGTCYKLYTRARDKKMHPFPKPEIQRVPLESLALHVKATKEGEDVKKFLGRAVDPPKVEAMDKALQVLHELGALDGKGKLTALGRHLAVLPLDLRLGKMLILATIFQCVDPILTIAAILSCKPIFLNPMDRRDEANAARASFATEKSDLLTDMHAYDEVAKIRMEGRGNREVRQFCEDSFISQSTVHDVGVLRGELYSALNSIGLVPISSKPADPALNTHSTSVPLLKAILLAAFYPRVSRVSLPRGALKFDQTAHGAIQRENTAKEYKVLDMRRERVWIHPASILFGESQWKSGLVVSFLRVATGKLYLRDVTEVPLYAMLLFGGDIQINHIGGGLRVGGREGEIKLKAWPRIGILVQQLRRLLDAQLMRSVESGDILDVGKNNPVIKAMLALLANDGLSPQNI